MSISDERQSRQYEKLPLSGNVKISAFLLGEGAAGNRRDLLLGT
jgi:hypothetical protein